MSYFDDTDFKQIIYFGQKQLVAYGSFKEPVFKCIDVCKALEIDKSSDLVEEIKKNFMVGFKPTIKQRGQQPVYISIKGVYEIAFRTKSKHAQLFRDWAKNIIETIRTQGECTKDQLQNVNRQIQQEEFEDEKQKENIIDDINNQEEQKNERDSYTIDSNKSYTLIPKTQQQNDIFSDDEEQKEEDVLQNMSSPEEESVSTVNSTISNKNQLELYQSIKDITNIKKYFKIINEKNIYNYPKQSVNLKDIPIDFQDYLQNQQQDMDQFQKALVTRYNQKNFNQNFDGTTQYLQLKTINIGDQKAYMIKPGKSQNDNKRIKSYKDYNIIEVIQCNTKTEQQIKQFLQKQQLCFNLKNINDQKEYKRQSPSEYCITDIIGIYMLLLQLQVLEKSIHEKQLQLVIQDDSKKESVIIKQEETKIQIEQEKTKQKELDYKQKQLELLRKDYEDCIYTKEEYKIERNKILDQK